MGNLSLNCLPAEISCFFWKCQKTKLLLVQTGQSTSIAKIQKGSTPDPLILLKQKPLNNMNNKVISYDIFGCRNWVLCLVILRKYFFFKWSSFFDVRHCLLLTPMMDRSTQSSFLNCLLYIFYSIFYFWISMQSFNSVKLTRYVVL